MKNHKKYIQKIAAELMIASMMTVQVSTLALADTQTPTVEITDYGPLGASTSADNSISLVPSGESTASGTETATGNSTTVTYAGPTAAGTSGTVTGAGAGTAQSAAGTVATSETAGTAAAVTSGTSTTVTETGSVTVDITSENTATDSTYAGSAATSASTASVSDGTASSVSAGTTVNSAAANTASAGSASANAASGTETGSAGTTADASGSAASTVVGTNFFQTASGNSFLQTSLTAHPEVNANYAILVDADSNLVVAEKNSETKMYPASMTKVMTLLVACEHITNLSDEVEITSDIVKYVNDNDASNCGFKAGEKVTIQDLLYGLILPSGADAALALVRYIAGSEEQFVNLMNQKAQELGISATTHYTNSTGLYNDNHYTTAKDMALVMKYAAANPYASAVLSTRSYTTKPNNKRSTGLTFSNLFLKRIDSQATGGTALMAKTGYVSKAGNCAVSCFTGASGKKYILVTGKTSGAWNVVYAHRDLYKTYGK